MFPWFQLLILCDQDHVHDGGELGPLQVCWASGVVSSADLAQVGASGHSLG